jgi:two-component system, cell cycle response regulator
MIALRNWYRERLPGRIAALEEVRSRLKQEVPGTTDAVRRIAHALRGSGATYGFREITDAAGHLEEARDTDLLPCLDALLRTLDSVLAGAMPRRKSILVVEDDQDQARFMVEALAAPDRDLLLARTAEEAQAILEREDVSLILLDLVLPDSDGRNFLSRLQERLGTAQIPVVVLTALRARQARAECLALGADDFIEKPVRLERLHAVAGRLRLGAGMARELGRDRVTGLPNRAAFHEYFKRIRSGIVNSHDPTTAAILALDRFESLNQEHGPKAGDAAMRHAAKILAQTLRSSDFLGRWNGCEFTALLPRTEPAGASAALRTALGALRESPLRFGKSSLKLSFSAGLSLVQPGGILDDVLDEADRHLHAAQEAGGGRIVSAEDHLLPPRRKILIADDDELIRMLLRRLLEREGYEVLQCSDGLAALKSAVENPVSMVITDGSMPVMDGFELVGRLRALPKTAALPIIMLTSMGSEPDVVKGFELGADDYVVKPFASGELLARIRRQLKRVPHRG